MLRRRKVKHESERRDGWGAGDGNPAGSGSGSAQYQQQRDREDGDEDEDEEEEDVRPWPPAPAASSLSAGLVGGNAAGAGAAPGKDVSDASNGTAPGEDWRSVVRARLPPYKVRRKRNSRRRRWLTRWFRCIVQLPWTTMVVLGVVLGIIILFVVFVLRNNQTNSANNNSNTRVLTIQCDTSVSEADCKALLAGAAQSQDTQQALTEAHLFTTLGVFWFATTLFFIVKAVRTRRTNQYLNSLPRSAIWPEDPSVWTGEGDVQTGSLRRTQTLPIQLNMHRSRTLAQLAKDLDPIDKCGDPNWGPEPTPDDSAWSRAMAGHRHLPTIVTKSFVKLEAVVRGALPPEWGLEIRPDETVRDFVVRVKFALNAAYDALRDESVARGARVGLGLLDAYLDKYERAKFGEQAVTQKHYEAFLDAFSALVTELNDVKERLQRPRPPTPASPPSPASTPTPTPSSTPTRVASGLQHQTPTGQQAGTPSRSAASGTKPAGAGTRHRRSSGGAVAAAPLSSSSIAASNANATTPTGAAVSPPPLVRQRTLSR